MQTPSDTSTNTAGEWVARTDTPRRSVFPNFPAPHDVEQPPTSPPEPTATATSIQQDIDLAVARSFICRWLALAYQDPNVESFQALTASEQLECLLKTADTYGIRVSALDLTRECAAADFDHYRVAYFSVFGHSARGRCPLNEIEYGELSADPLFQPHRLADLAAFYRAFGLELAPDADERHDHISMQLEFMSVLAAKEAYAVEHQLDCEELSVCREAQRKFLREHLGRWSPAFCRRLAAAALHPVQHRLAGFTLLFIETECARAGVKAGNHDMLLRPIDEAAENMCASCGLGQLPPGAAAPTL